MEKEFDRFCVVDVVVIVAVVCVDCPCQEEEEEDRRFSFQIVCFAFHCRINNKVKLLFSPLPHEPTNDEMRNRTFSC